MCYHPLHAIPEDAGNLLDAVGFHHLMTDLNLHQKFLHQENIGEFCFYPISGFVMVWFGQSDR